FSHNVRRLFSLGKGVPESHFGSIPTENRMLVRIQPASFCNFHFSIFNLRFPPRPSSPFPRPALERGLARRNFASWLICFAMLAGVCSAATAQDAPPRSLDPRVKIELFAEHPQIVTPTGIDVDRKGRVWAVESNTHFPPEDYKGHPTDRVLVMSDTDQDGKADRIVVFTDGLKHTMSVAVRPHWLSIDPASGGRAPIRRELVPPGGTKPAPGSTDKTGDDSANGEKKNARTNQGGNPPRSPKASVYIATRREISLFHDDDGDDK